MRVGLFGLLGIVFIVLKLTGVIDWSWWLVTMPLWAGVAFTLLILIIAYLCELYATFKIDKKWGYKLWQNM